MGGDADKDHTQIIGGGIQSNYWGKYPPPPGFGTPKSNYADQIQCLYSAVVRSVTTPLACQTKCRIKKIARFSSFKTVFCIEIDSKMIESIFLKRLFKRGANLSKIKLINQKKTLKHSQKSVSKFDRILKMLNIGFIKSYISSGIREEGGYSVSVNYQSLL